MTFFARAGKWRPRVESVGAEPGAAAWPGPGDANRFESISDANASEPRPIAHWPKSCRRVMPRSCRSCWSIIWLNRDAGASRPCLHRSARARRPCELNAISFPRDGLVQVQQHAADHRPRRELLRVDAVGALVLPEQVVGALRV